MLHSGRALWYVYVKIVLLISIQVLYASVSILVVLDGREFIQFSSSFTAKKDKVVVNPYKYPLKGQASHKEVKSTHLLSFLQPSLLYSHSNCTVYTAFLS